MKKFFLSLCVMFALFGFINIANAGFLTGFIFGGALGGDGGNSRSGGANVLYVLPRAAERIKDPLQMRTKVGNEFGCVPKQDTPAENFSDSVKNSGNFTVVQVLLVPRAEGNTCFVYWFTYIEKSQVTPIDQLPQSKTAQ